MKGIIYLEKSSLDYYAEKMQSIPKLVFPADVIRDIEVIDVVKLDQSIKAFITTNKLLPATLTIVLANSIIFTKDIAQPIIKPVDKSAIKLSPLEQEEKDEVDKKDSVGAQTERFLETVPFNEVNSISLPIQNGVKIIAGNKELYTYIKRTFEKYGFSVEAVTSLLIFGAVANPVDQTIARRLFTKIDMARQHNMLTLRAPSVTKQTGFVKSAGPKQSKTKLYAMIGIFGVLVLIMVYMAYTTFSVPVPAPDKKTEDAPAVAQLPATSPALEVPIASTSAGLALSKVSVQIVSTAPTGSESASLRTALEDAGIQTVTTKRATSNSSRTIISVVPTFPAAQRDALQTVVTDLFPGATILEAEDLPTDVVITIGTGEN